MKVAMIMSMALALASCGINKKEATSEAKASQVTVQTFFTCEQEDGDQWKQIGVGLNDGPGLVAYVVNHDVDFGTAVLEGTYPVTEIDTGAGVLSYQDPMGVFRLDVGMKTESSWYASAWILYDGGPAYQNPSMHCYQQDMLQFTVL
jgi:hypothetical protein